MKYALVLIFVIFNVFLVGTSKAALLRQKCPEGSTNEQCLEYAKSVSDNLAHCNRFIVAGGSIQWQTCGAIQCGANVTLVAEDRSKPYPDCCPHCN